MARKAPLIIQLYAITKGLDNTLAHLLLGESCPTSWHLCLRLQYFGNRYSSVLSTCAWAVAYLSRSTNRSWVSVIHFSEKDCLH